MRAAWHERQGPATNVLKVGNLPLPEPTAGEGRVQLQLSGVNTGDVIGQRPAACRVLIGRLHCLVGGEGSVVRV